MRLLMLAALGSWQTAYTGSSQAAPNGYGDSRRRSARALRADRTSMLSEAPSTLVFYHPSQAALAKRIVEESSSGAWKRGGSRRRRIILGRCSWNAFPDGFPELRVAPEHAAAITQGCKVAFIASFHSPDIIFEQLALIYTLASLRAREYRVIVPYFATGTMERVDSIGQVATAATMARLLSATPQCGTGPSTVAIFDIHALQEQFYFSDSVIVQLRSAIILLRRELAPLLAEASRGGLPVSIVFPDEGAAKRFAPAFADLEQVRCLKIRDGDSRAVTIRDGEPRDSHCVIVDDLVHSGGTLLACAEALHAAGAARISCFATHGVFPKASWRRFAQTEAEGGLFHRFWITDTVPTTAAAVEGVEPFRVLSIAPLLENMLSGDPPLIDPISGCSYASLSPDEIR